MNYYYTTSYSQPYSYSSSYTYTYPDYSYTPVSYYGQSYYTVPAASHYYYGYSGYARVQGGGNVIASGPAPITYSSYSYPSQYQDISYNSNYTYPQNYQTVPTNYSASVAGNYGAGTYSAIAIVGILAFVVLIGWLIFRRR